MRQRDRTWIAIFIIVLLLGTLAVLFPILIPKGTTRPFSSDNPGKSGVKAVYDLLEERGKQVQKWERGWDHLPNAPGNVLFIIIGPDSRSTDKEKIHSLRDWVETGNTAVIWSSAANPFLDELGFMPVPAASGSQTVSVTKNSEQWLRNIKRLVLPGNSRIHPGEDIEAVLTDLQGEILVACKKLGKGQIFYIPDPDMITNQFIDGEDNVVLPLFFASFAEKTLWFDESVPRLAGDGSFGEEDPAADLTNWSKNQGIFVAAQACIALFLWLYVQGKRFAAPRWETVERLRSQNEYIEAMAALYRSSRLYRESLDILERSFLRDTAKALGFPPGVSLERLTERISSIMGGETERRFRSLLREIDHRKKTKTKEKDLIRLSQEMERCRREIQNWKIGQ